MFDFFVVGQHTLSLYSKTGITSITVIFDFVMFVTLYSTKISDSIITLITLYYFLATGYITLRNNTAISLITEIMFVCLSLDSPHLYLSNYFWCEIVHG